MPQLVERGPHPALVGTQVQEDPHVALAVDVGGERVLVLSLLLVEARALEDPLDRQPDARVEATGEVDQILPAIHGVEVDAVDRRHLLEESVLVVPWTESGLVHAVELAELPVDLFLELGERRVGQRLEPVEEAVDRRGLLLADPELHVVVVGVPDGPGGFVAEAHELVQPAGHDGPDGFQALPRGLEDGGIALVGERDLEIVEGAPLSAHHRPEGREIPLDPCGQPVDPLAQRFVGLAREGLEVQKLDRAVRDPIAGRRLARAPDLLEETGPPVQPIDAVARPLETAVVPFPAGDRGVPPGSVHLGGQGTERGDEIVDAAGHGPQDRGSRKPRSGSDLTDRSGGPRIPACGGRPSSCFYASSHPYGAAAPAPGPRKAGLPLPIRRRASDSSS